MIDIPEEDKVCRETDLPLIKIGEKVSTKLAHKPGSFYLKQIVRPKYALPAKSSEGGIVTAELPGSLLDRCQADESLLATILVKKKKGDYYLPRPELEFGQSLNVGNEVLSLAIRWMHIPFQSSC